MIPAGSKLWWFIRSTQDPRWNHHGTAISRVGGGPPCVLVDKLDELVSLHGNPPEDLEWNFWTTMGEDILRQDLWVACKCGNIVQTTPSEISDQLDSVTCDKCHEKLLPR